MVDLGIDGLGGRGQNSSSALIIEIITLTYVLVSSLECSQVLIKPAFVCSLECSQVLIKPAFVMPDSLE